MNPKTNHPLPMFQPAGALSRFLSNDPLRLVAQPADIRIRGVALRGLGRKLRAEVWVSARQGKGGEGGREGREGEREGRGKEEGPKSKLFVSSLQISPALEKCQVKVAQQNSHRTSVTGRGLFSAGSPNLRDDLVVDTMLLQECQHLRAPWELLQNRVLGTAPRILAIARLLMKTEICQMDDVCSKC